MAVLVKVVEVGHAPRVFVGAVLVDTVQVVLGVLVVCVLVVLTYMVVVLLELGGFLLHVLVFVGLFVVVVFVDHLFVQPHLYELVLDVQEMSGIGVG